MLSWTAPSRSGAAPAAAPAGGLTGTQVNLGLDPRTILGGGAPVGTGPGTAPPPAVATVTLGGSAVAPTSSPMTIAGTGMNGTVSTPIPTAPLTTVPLPLIPPRVETPLESFPADSNAGQPTVSSTPIAPPLLPPALITTPTPVLPHVWTMAQNDPRNSPGTATSSAPLPEVTGQWLRGTDGNAGLVPAQVAEQLQGQQFNNFGEFRSAFWKAVANVPDLAEQFSRPNQALMQQGKAPVAPSSQQYGAQDTYILHHIDPIAKGGGVYDMSNIAVVTPAQHQSILDPKYHFGGSPK